MAQVAACPQCNQELLVPDETDRESWAKCPECRAYFQVNQAVLREIPPLLVVESQSPALASRSPVEDVLEYDQPDEPVDRAPEPVPDMAEHAQAVPNKLHTSTEVRAAAERIDDWFRSAKTVADSPASFPRHLEQDAGADLEAGDDEADIPLEGISAAPASGAAWDDSHHMERLLADIETPSADKPTDEVLAAPPALGVYGDNIAATSVSDLPVFTKGASGKPRRQRSLLRSIAVIAMAGVIGSALGYYALLWMLGTDGDFLKVAKYLPQMMLPAEMHAKPRPLPAAAPSTPAPVQDQPELATASPAETTSESAEVQATFTTTDEPAPAQSSAGDDRYGIEATAAPSAEEPAALDVPAAVPLTENAASADAPRPANAPIFTADELTAALQLSKEAQPSLAAGNLEDGPDVQRAKANSYLLLADLAQKVTLVDASSNPELIAASQQAAAELFRTTLSDEHTRGEVGKIVPKWIASPHRKHGGVFFAATLSGGGPAGSVVECSGSLAAGQSIPILLPPTWADRLDDSSRPLGIVGWIVDTPAEQITGYTGQAQQAIWVGKLIPLE